MTERAEAKRPVTFRLPPDLVVEIDRMATDRGWDRTAFVERALSRVVEAERERLTREAQP